jgi:hypothetical protein
VLRSTVTSCPVSLCVFRAPLHWIIPGSLQSHLPSSPGRQHLRTSNNRITTIARPQGLLPVHSILQQLLRNSVACCSKAMPRITHADTPKILACLTTITTTRHPPPGRVYRQQAPTSDAESKPYEIREHKGGRKLALSSTTRFVTRRYKQFTEQAYTANIVWCAVRCGT